MSGSSETRQCFPSLPGQALAATRPRPHAAHRPLESASRVPASPGSSGLPACSCGLSLLERGTACPLRDWVPDQAPRRGCSRGGGGTPCGVSANLARSSQGAASIAGARRRVPCIARVVRATAAPRPRRDLATGAPARQLQPAGRDTPSSRVRAPSVDPLSSTTTALTTMLSYRARVRARNRAARSRRPLD